MDFCTSVTLIPTYSNLAFIIIIRVYSLFKIKNLLTTVAKLSFGMIPVTLAQDGKLFIF